jgi:type IV secretory pathway VirB2 component (pilin)
MMDRIIQLKKWGVMMFKGNFPAKALAGYVVLSLLMLVVADAAFAASTSSTSVLPISAPLQVIRDFFTGAFAWTASIICIVVTGSTMAFHGAELSGFGKTMIFLACVLAIVVFANNFLSSAFSGAVIPL